MNKFLSTTMSVLTLAALCGPAFALKAPVPAPSAAPAVKTTAAPMKLIKGQKIQKNKSTASKKVAKSCNKVEKTAK
jgi:hypothetical protein